MTPFWWGFVAGMFIGGFVGFIVAAIMVMAGRAEQHYEKMVKRYEKQCGQGDPEKTLRG